MQPPAEAGRGHLAVFITDLIKRGRWLSGGTIRCSAEVSLEDGEALKHRRTTETRAQQVSKAERKVKPRPAVSFAAIYGLGPRNVDYQGSKS